MQRREVARQHKIKQRPQLANAVFHGRAGQSQARVRLQALGRARAHAVHVFDVLRLVQHHKAEGHLRQLIHILPQQRVAGQHHIDIIACGHAGHQGIALGGRAHGGDDLQFRRKARKLIDPVVDQRGGHHHQRGHAIGPGAHGMADGRNGLHRFAQAHLIGQYAAHAQRVQRAQPVEPVQLIGVQTFHRAVRALGSGESVRFRVNGQVVRRGQRLQIGRMIAL